MKIVCCDPGRHQSCRMIRKMYADMLICLGKLSATRKLIKLIVLQHIFAVTNFICDNKVISPDQSATLGNTFILRDSED